MRSCRVFLFGLLLLLGGPLAVAQAPDSLRLSDLRTPAAPGFLLLDVAPTSVAQPQTPRALALSMLSAGGQEHLLPQNYALEVAPYWLVPHYTLTFEDYYQAGIGASLLQTLSLSMATLPLDPEEPSAGTRVSFGFRTIPFAGDGQALRQRIDPLLQRLNAIQDEVLLLLDEADMAAVPVDSTQLHTLRDEARATALRIQEASTERTGFILEIAGAAVWTFPQGDFENATKERLGLWITPAYRLYDPDLDVLGVVRLLREPLSALSVSTATFLDLGGRLRWALSSFALSVEALGRLVLDSPEASLGPLFDNTYRISGMIEYDVSDDFQLFASFGRNFDVAGRRNNLIALIGINYGFGRRAFVQTPTGF